MLPRHCRDVCVRGGAVFDVVLSPILDATVLLGHLIDCHPQNVETEDKFEPQPLLLIGSNPRA